MFSFGYVQIYLDMFSFGYVQIYFDIFSFGYVQFGYVQFGYVRSGYVLYVLHLSVILITRLGTARVTSFLKQVVTGKK